MDVDDTEEVIDKVIDRMVSLQVDEELPLYLIALSTPERIAKELEEYKRERGWPPGILTVTEGLP